MSLFRKLFPKTDTRPASASSPLASQAPYPSQTEPKWDEIARLEGLGQPDGPDESTGLGLIQWALASPRQREALQAVSRAMDRAPVFESIRVACAHALVDRGERTQALAFLDHVAKPPSLMLLADLLHDEGHIAQAVATLERVLARDIDTPGARERHERWRNTLQKSQFLHSPPRTAQDETLVAPAIQKLPYRIVREAARGGAGTVYEARDDVIGRPLALKVYHQIEKNQTQIRRETRIAIQLASPNVIQVLDVDFDIGWIAMPWLPHGSVRDIIRRKNLPSLGNPHAFARNLAQALARIHHHGWVHADMKPANILVGTGGTPILSDFGIAVRPGEESLGGSPGFLSPERLSGSPPNPSDDIYGFGRILEDIVETGASDWEPLRRLSHRCMSPGETRPHHGTDLVSLVDSMP